MEPRLRQTAVQEMLPEQCTVRGDCPLSQEVLMALSGEGGGGFGSSVMKTEQLVLCCVDHWYVENIKKSLYDGSLVLKFINE